MPRAVKGRSHSGLDVPVTTAAKTILPQCRSLGVCTPVQVCSTHLPPGSEEEEEEEEELGIAQVVVAG